MEGMINDKYAMVCARPCGHVECNDRDKAKDGIASWDVDGYLRDTKGRIIVPDYRNLRERIMRLRHDAPLGGHGGQVRTSEAVSRNYSWPGMEADTAEYVHLSHVCEN